MDITIETHNGFRIEVRIFPWGREPWAASVSITKGCDFETAQNILPAEIRGNFSVDNLQADDAHRIGKAMDIALSIQRQLDEIIVSHHGMKAVYEVRPDYLMGAKIVNVGNPLFGNSALHESEE